MAGAAAAWLACAVRVASPWVVLLLPSLRPLLLLLLGAQTVSAGAALAALCVRRWRARALTAALFLLLLLLLPRLLLALALLALLLVLLWAVAWRCF